MVQNRYVPLLKRYIAGENDAANRDRTLDHRRSRGPHTGRLKKPGPRIHQAKLQTCSCDLLIPVKNPYSFQLCGEECTVSRSIPFGVLRAIGWVKKRPAFAKI